MIKKKVLSYFGERLFLSRGLFSKTEELFKIKIDFSKVEVWL